MIVIVHGTQGRVESLHASALALHFGLNRIQPDWNGKTSLQDGSLVLTNDKAVAKRAGRHLGVVSISLAKAICLAGRPRVMATSLSAMTLRPTNRRPA